MITKANKETSFDTKGSIKKSQRRRRPFRSYEIDSDRKSIPWPTKMEQVQIIRQGLPYDSIELLSQRLNLPIKSVLAIMGIPQTTYNKKKSEQALLDSRDSELIILITELIEYGLEVFNNEAEKFHRWLKKSNLALNRNAPESLLDTVTGIEEIKSALNRIEFGNFA